MIPMMPPKKTASWLLGPLLAALLQSWTQRSRRSFCSCSVLQRADWQYTKYWQARWQSGVWVGGADERERTLNQLLSEMSGFEPSASVIVLGATNRPDILDAALLRPGRFDRRIAVELPSQADRAQILRLHARMLTLEDAL